jgi:hypothetical protein
METKHLATRVSAIIILLGFVLFIGGCKKPSASNPYPYTPDDFSNPLRDLLKKIEQHNIVYLSNSGCRGDGSIYDSAEVYYGQLSYLAATKELLKASRCSNPSIRATALSILLYDTTVNAANLVREHMFDTAQVFDDYSLNKWTIISFMLHNSYRWPDRKERTQIERELIQNMPFELASYHLLSKDYPIDTFPGFYEIVKKMARNLEKCSHNSILNWHVGRIAMERLAKYKEDIPLLDTLFKSSLYFANGYFFPAKAIKNFPAVEFEKYYLDTSIRWMMQFRFLWYDDYYKYTYDPSSGLYDFIRLVIGHRSEKSAFLLEKIIDNPPLEFSGQWNIRRIKEEKEILFELIARGIREEKCPFYSKLIKRTEKYNNDGNEYWVSYDNGDDASPRFPQNRATYGKHFEAYWWE